MQHILLLLSAALAVLIPSLYMVFSTSHQGSFPSLRNKRICLLIAHPDDEAMFFAPTVLALTRPETGNHVKILCLSSGNADGLGETRKKELVKSAMLLGLRDEDDVFVVDNPADFPDSMKATWDKSKIATLLCSAFAPDLPRPTANIDVLVTFDRSGISSHPNHISLHHGARAFLEKLTTTGGGPSPVAVYSLTTVNVLRKYGSIVDLFATLASWYVRGEGNAGSSNKEKDGGGEAQYPPGLLFVNKLSGEAALGTAWTAMTEAHKSQMVWFRYLWITFSRYMVINDLRLEKVGGQVS